MLSPEQKARGAIDQLLTAAGWSVQDFKAADINLGGDAASMKVTGSKNVTRFHALIREPGQRTKRSPAWRHFCKKCGRPLWLWDKRWPELIHPHASAIDTPLPKPPEVVEADLANAPSWVDVPSGKGHVHCEGWPRGVAARVARPAQVAVADGAARRVTFRSIFPTGHVRRSAG